MEASLLPVELPKRLKDSTTEVIKTFKRNEEFKLVVALWSRSTMVSIFKRVSTDIFKVVDTQFLLDYLPSMKGFLALQARESEVAKMDEDEGSESGATSPRKPLPLIRLRLHPRPHLILQGMRHLFIFLLPRTCLPP